MSLGRPIYGSPDLTRVLALPRRAPPDRKALAEMMTAALRRENPNCKCAPRKCITKLNEVQAWALFEMAHAGGACNPIGVGRGKTGIDVLAAMVMPNCRSAVLFIPAALRAQFLEVDFPAWAEHFKVPNLAGGRFFVAGRPVLHVVAYSELSGAKATDLLDQLKPDLVIADELHNLRNPTAARTKRFRRCFQKRPETRFVGHTGTLTTKSVLDMFPFLALALRQGSPGPLHHPTQVEWAGALDPSEFPSDPGALTLLGEKGEDIRTAFQRRLRDTFGVVYSAEDGDCQASLIMQERPAVAPAKIIDTIRVIEEKWQRPDGEELTDIFAKIRCASQLACGFYYRWRWPRGEPVKVIERWLEVRKRWHCEIREKLKRSKEFLDSPLLLTEAAIRWHDGYHTKDGVSVAPHTKHGPRPTWDSDVWPEWREVRGTAQPETEAIWVSDYLVQDAAKWCAENVGIVWYEHDAFGKALAKLTGLPRYGPGTEASVEILKEKGDRTIIASRKPHGEGKNLQAFSVNLVANPFPNGTLTQQLLGRTHRPGQTADVVSFDLYRHIGIFREALDSAISQAQYVLETVPGASQKILQAARLWK